MRWYNWLARGLMVCLIAGVVVMALPLAFVFFPVGVVMELSGGASVRGALRKMFSELLELPAAVLGCVGLR